MYDILKYGAVGDGVTNCAEMIQKAIDTCSEAGGGTVRIPAGRFLSGSIVLKSNVNLHLEMGAVLVSSLEEKEIYDGRFITAYHEKNIAITGYGVIDGQGDKVFVDDDKDLGFHECPKNIVGFRPRMLVLEDVENLLVENVTLKDAAQWTLHLAGCKSVRIQGIRIMNDVRGANNDGIDPDCCQDVIIQNCIIKTGDDAIVVKATKPMKEKYGNCENIVISNCILKSQDSALKIGTETHGDIRNVLFQDCIVEDCSRALGVWVRDGGTIEKIRVHHLTGSVRRYADAYERDRVHDFAPGWWGKGEPIFISAVYRNEERKYPGAIREISIDHIYLDCESSLFMKAEEECAIEQVSISDMELCFKKQGTQPGGLFDEQPSIYGVYEHEIPGIYARYVNGLSIKESKIRKGKELAAPWAGLVQLEHCEGSRIEVEEI